MIKRYIIPVLLTVIIIQLFFVISLLNNCVFVEKQLVVEDSISIPTLNQENLLNEIIKQEISNPDFVLAQSLQECGDNLNSKNVKQHNNIFGFRLKKLVTKNNPYGYIHYESWLECVKYYKTWQSNRLYNGEDYFSFLKRIKYAEDTNYTVAIKQKLYTVRKKFKLN